MIFVTVGTQLPFDRLVAAVDAWAGAASGRDVFAQIGPTELRPRNIEFASFVRPQECRERMLAATAIVAHAGMGSILTALELGKPLVIMPRRAALSEHRNDHQLATAKRFVGRDGVTVAFDETELALRLDERDDTSMQPRISPHAPEELLVALRAFIAGTPLTPASGETSG